MSVADEVLELIVPLVVVVATMTVEQVEEGDGDDTSGFKGGADCGPEPLTIPSGRSVVAGAAVSSSSFFFIASSLSFTSLSMRRASVMSVWPSPCDSVKERKKKKKLRNAREI